MPPQKRMSSNKRTRVVERVSYSSPSAKPDTPLLTEHISPGRKTKRKSYAEPDSVDLTDQLVSAMRELDDRLMRPAGPSGSQASRMLLFDDPLDNPRQNRTQLMVASAADLIKIAKLQEYYPDQFGRLTANQVWSLLSAHMRGEQDRARNTAQSIVKLQQLNEQFKTRYTADDLPAILRALRTRRLCTNYFLTLPPGGNRAPGSTAAPLVDQLIADDEGRFRNIWETGASQASDDASARGGVEENFGYASALWRTSGIPLQKDNNVFAREPTPMSAQVTEVLPAEGRAYLEKLRKESPNVLQARELPKYGASVGPDQLFGVSPRYGETVVYWKSDIGWRTTRTAGDSWGMFGAHTFASAHHPEAVFQHLPADIARLVAAEGTFFESDAELDDELTKTGRSVISDYIEVQIHGDLSWHDVDHIVVNYGVFPSKPAETTVTRQQAEDLVEKLSEFAATKQYDFTVSLGMNH